MGNGWLSPVDLQNGDALTAGKIRQMTASLEAKLNRGITGNDFARITVDGRPTVQINADIDLLGRKLMNATNVPTGIVSVKAHSVQGNGSEEGAAIQAALEAIASTGGSVAFFPGGTYLTHSKILVPRDMSIMGSGTGTVISFVTGADENAPAFELSGTCTLRDIKMVGDALGNRTAIKISNGQDITIDNVAISGGKIGIQISGSGSDGITLSDIRCSGALSGGDFVGLYASDGVNLTVMGFSCASAKSAMILSACDQFEIICASSLAASEDGFLFSGCKNGTVVVSSQNSQKVGINLVGCERVTLLGSHAIDFSNNAGFGFPGIMVDGGARNVVQSCHAYIQAAGSTPASYCCHIRGTKTLVAGNDFGPTRSSGGLLDYTRDACFRDDGSETTEYGNFKVVL